jgi:CheY-like chemotaxis protein
MAEKSGFLVIAAVDCTGHGVPGAFMSMLGVAFLNDIINKATFNRHFLSLGAGKVLDQLREHVINSLHQSDEDSENKDGMDISLTIFDLEENHLQFAGAHNPICIIRRGEMIKIDGDPMPIGVFKTDDQPFANREFELEEDDRVYLFTDGYYDQFGGPKGSKMLSANFRKYLLEIYQEPMDKQKKLLEDFYDNWKGTYDQLDDVTIIGFKFQSKYKVSNTPQYKLWHDKRILIAEDVEINFLLLVEALRPTQTKIFRAENGRDAVDYCKSNDYELVLMDINMPIMDGIEATKLIKSFKPDLPVVAQTAIGSDEDIEKIMNAGCDDYISKPIDLKKFLSIVRKYIIK